jgi:hypothetical protein
MVHTEAILLLVLIDRRIDEGQWLQQGYTIRFRSLAAISFKNPRQGISHYVIYSTSMLHSELEGG